MMNVFSFEMIYLLHFNVLLVFGQRIPETDGENMLNDYRLHLNTIIFGLLFCSSGMYVLLDLY